MESERNSWSIAVSIPLRVRLFLSFKMVNAARLCKCATQSCSTAFKIELWLAQREYVGSHPYFLRGYFLRCILWKHGVNRVAKIPIAVRPPQTTRSPLLRISPAPVSHPARLPRPRRNPIVLKIRPTTMRSLCSNRRLPPSPVRNNQEVVRQLPSPAQRNPPKPHQRRTIRFRRTNLRLPRNRMAVKVVDSLPIVRKTNPPTLPATVPATLICRRPISGWERALPPAKKWIPLPAIRRRMAASTTI